MIASLNPLSYAIEPIRYLYLNDHWSLSSVVMVGPFGSISFGGALLVLVIFDLVALTIIQPLLQKRLA